MFTLLRTMLLMNVLLAAFNALPIPPLDGSRVADALMPSLLRPAWEDFCRLGPIALAAVLILPRLCHVNLFIWPLAATQWVLQHAVRLVS